MRCPYCHQSIRVQGRFCPKCGEQIFGLPVRQREPTAPPPAGAPVPGSPRPPPAPPPDLGGDTLDIVVEETGPAGDRTATPAPLPASGAHAASGEEVGKTCPYCRFPIKPGEQVYVCPACKVIHHADCWRENQGCTTYGCRGAAAVAPPPAGPVHGPRPGTHPAVTRMPDLALLQAREMEGRANNALWMSVLGCFCCPPMTLVGLFMALSLLGEVSRAAVAAGRARTKAIVAVCVSVATLLGWLIYLVRMGQQPYG